jgi:hypothetical protein
MTPSTRRRLARLYEKLIGYDPFAEGWTEAEVLETLREYRTEILK